MIASRREGKRSFIHKDGKSCQGNICSTKCVLSAISLSEVSFAASKEQEERKEKEIDRSLPFDLH